MSDERGNLPSASSLYILYACLGSWNAQKDLPEDESSSVEAQEGTEIAEALESEDFTGLDEDGRTIAQRLKKFTDDALDEWWRSIGGVPFEVFKEKRLWIHDRQNLKPLASARLDWFAIAPPYAVAIDHKSGYIPVTAARKNVQVRIQALALWHEYPELTTILAGTAQYRFVGKVDMTEYRVRDLEFAQRELELKLWQAKDPTAPRVPGEHCRYCRAKAFCPEAASYSLLPIATLPMPVSGEADVSLAVSQLTHEQLAFVRSRKAIIEKIISAVDARLRGLSAEELSAVGLALSKPGTVTSVANKAEAKRLLMEKGLVTEEQWNNATNVVLGRLEELVAPQMNKETKKADKEAFLALLAPTLAHSQKLPSIRLLKEKN